MNFKQLDHEHVTQAWERVKLRKRNCPTHGLNLWMIVQDFYAGLNFASSNHFDSAAGGTFMEITLGEATKLLDNLWLIILNGTPKDLLVKRFMRKKRLMF